MAIHSLPIRTITTPWVSGEITVRKNQRDVNVQLLSDDWPATPDGRTIAIQIDQSSDGGTTGRHWVGITCAVGAWSRYGTLPAFGVDFVGDEKRIRVAVTPSATVRLGAQVSVV